MHLNGPRTERSGKKAWAGNLCQMGHMSIIARGSVGCPLYYHDRDDRNRNHGYDYEHHGRDNRGHGQDNGQPRQKGEYK